jgi:hypothetical protein
MTDEELDLRIALTIRWKELIKQIGRKLSSTEVRSS